MAQYMSVCMQPKRRGSQCCNVYSMYWKCQVHVYRQNFSQGEETFRYVARIAPCVGPGSCSISHAPRFLAECRNRRLKQDVFCVLVMSSLFILSASLKWLPVKAASRVNCVWGGGGIKYFLTRCWNSKYYVQTTFQSQQSYYHSPSSRLC